MIIIIVDLRKRNSMIADCGAILDSDFSETGSESLTLCHTKPLLEILVTSGELHVPRVRGRRHQHDHRTGGNIHFLF